MSESILVSGGTVTDSLGARKADLLVSGGVIVEAREEIDHSTADTFLDARSCLVLPGLVDMHAHLREPGGERAETIATASAAAALGGYTAVVAMANTDPVADSAAVVTQVTTEAERVGRCLVLPAAAITRGLEGVRLTPMAELASLGVRIFSDDGKCLADADLMRRALEYLDPLDCLVSNHAEDACLVAGGGIEGAMNEGELSGRLGLPGRPALAEEVIVARDIALAESTGGRLHVPHVSSARSVSLIRSAKERGVRVTAEATPHHLVLTEEKCEGYDPLYRVNPPLRAAEDVAALVEGVVDGTIDVIATDHAPHPPEEKERGFEDAPPGMLGLETAFSVIYTHLVATGRLSLSRAVEVMSSTPAELLGLERHGGPLVPGRPANLTVIDPEATWEVDGRALASLSENTPFGGELLRSRIRHTVFEGRAVVVDEKVVK